MYKKELTNLEITYKMNEKYISKQLRKEDEEMRKTKKMVLMIIVALCASILAASLADSGIKAELDGSTLTVTWNGAGNGSCTLEVYQNGWPVRLCTVNGGDGAATINLGTAAGKYTVRLKTPNGCMTADVQAGNTLPTPTPRPTVKPTATPAPAKTARPAATPSPKPTATPMATAKPATPPSPAGTTGNIRNDLASEVVRQVNEERAKYGLSQLRTDAELTRAARVRAEEIVRSFSHTRPDGSKWATVSVSAYGENIAMGQKTADKVMAAWLTSEGHRANILRPSYGSIGVCALTVNGVTYWVQLFGK